MPSCHIRKLVSWAIVALLCTPIAQAASEEILSAADACAKLDWRDQAGYERSKNYRGAVNCFKALYIRVAGNARLNEAFEEELSKRLDELETAYRASRNVCKLLEKLGLNDGGCGTIDLSSHEFVMLLKNMILNEDAGWTKRDPALAKALRLVE